jgi:hypothetical protein
MRRIWVLALILAAGCAAPRDAKVVAEPQPLPTLTNALQVDTTRLAAAAGGDGLAALRALLLQHFAAFAAAPVEHTSSGETALVAELPADGYRLRARTAPREDQYALVTLDLLEGSEAEAKPAMRAPWSAIDALHSVAAGLAALRPPRRPPLSPSDFQRLHAQAIELKQRGLDPPLDETEYVRAPRPLSAEGANAPYYAPPTTTGRSTLLDR